MEYLYCGLYDKTGHMNEKEQIYLNMLPTNVMKLKLEEKFDMFSGMLYRKDYPFNKKDGSEQNYHGWYFLVPVEREVLGISENMGVSMEPEQVQLKNEDGTDLTIYIGLKKYNVYGKFNIARTPNNWKLQITIK